MKKALFLFAFLLCCASAFAVTPTANQTCVQSTTTTLTCAASLAIGSGDAVVLFILYPNTTETTASVSDTCSNTWTHQTGASGVSSTNTLDTWTTVNATAGTCSITVTRNAGSIRFQWIAEDYSGVGSIGNFNETTHSSTTSTTIPVTTQDNNNFVVAGFGLHVASETCTATNSSTLRGSSTTTVETLCMTDNTAASPGSVTNGVSYGSASTGTNGAVELRASGATGRLAFDSDSGQLLVMNEGANSNYTLPGTPSTTFTHNKSNWNVTVFAHGALTYKIVVQSPALLNGQSGSITIPQWQHVRIYTDGTNYWSPDLPFNFPANGLGYLASATGLSQTGCHYNGVNAQTVSYTIVAADAGKLVTENGSSLTATLPNPAPTAQFCVTIQNLNASALTVARNSLNINGGTSNISLAQFQSTTIYSDGTNYFATTPIVAGTNLSLTQSAVSQTVNLGGSSLQTFGNTVRITADSGAIVATTPGSAATQFTFPTLSANTNYSFHCSGTTTQATAGAGIGIAITAGTNAPTHLEAHALVATSATATAASSSGDITSTTATAIYTGSAGTLTTQLPWYVDGDIQVGASVPTVTIGFFTANSSDAVTVKRDSYCTILP